MNIKHSLLSVSFILLAFHLFAQPPVEKREQRHEKIKTLKIAFITQKVDLTPEEAQKFWPVYNQYQKRLDELKKNRRHDFVKAKPDFAEMTDQDIEAMVDQEIVVKQKELDLQKEFHAKIKSVISIKKVAQLYAAEEQFKIHLIKELKEKRETHGVAPVK